ncbi:hypothetical protein F6X40_35430 [Paraburkholderia sp. UCT31]|uniref:hypothetical protein n=1 Tax=Paraburkholderia sp. UCT31 TaxID=2615209 RepID=UPI00165631F1|nr:hypothetical protein [Paraburkholderia sp. UCT31]MBC8741843.1 hypothetical protein [Paraburkholderia sp. UCT31]
MLPVEQNPVVTEEMLVAADEAYDNVMHTRGPLAATPAMRMAILAALEAAPFPRPGMLASDRAIGLVADTRKAIRELRRSLPADVAESTVNTVGWTVAVLCEELAAAHRQLSALKGGAPQAT